MTIWVSRWLRALMTILDVNEAVRSRVANSDGESLFYNKNINRDICCVVRV